MARAIGEVLLAGPREERSAAWTKWLAVISRTLMTNKAISALAAGIRTNSNPALGKQEEFRRELSTGSWQLRAPS